MSQTLQIVLGIAALIGVISGFLIWHFKEVKSFNKDIHDLQLKIKDLEKKDDLQQQTIDQLKELYPLFKIVFENFKK